MAYRMAFAADIVPTESNEQYFIDGDINRLFGTEMLDYLRGVDFRCFNLEAPLTTSSHTAIYPGPYLKAKPETIVAIEKLKPSLITIGNNHALDQGTQGLKDTMATLSNAGIPFIGAGNNLIDAAAPFITHLGESLVGIYNCTEYEFAAATENTCGANLYDPLVSFDHVLKLCEKTDFVIVLYHGGKEFYRYPSPQLQRVCRKFVECGANLVICQHTHCIGCEEKYGNGTIVYGQGNFLFDRKENEFKKTGMFVEYKVNNGVHSINYVPFVKQEECVRLANSTESSKIITSFMERGEQIKQSGFIRAEYEKLAKQEYNKYVKKIMGQTKLSKLISKIKGSKYYENYYDKRSALSVLNVISPENHAELFKTGLRCKGK